MRPTYVEGDIAVAAYLLFRYEGERLLEVQAAPGKPYQFVFDDSDGTCARNSIEFTRSDFQKYDNYVQVLRRRVRTAKNTRR